MAAVTVCSDFGVQENKACHCFHFSPSVCHEEMGPEEARTTMDLSLRKLWEIVKDREAWHAVVHEVAKSWTQLSDRAATKVLDTQTLLLNE